MYTRVELYNKLRNWILTNYQLHNRNGLHYSYGLLGSKSLEQLANREHKLV